MLALLPAVLLGGVSPAAAADHRAAPEPGTVVVHKVSPVIRYRLESWDPVTGSQLDSGTIRFDYTCYPSVTDEMPESVEVFLFTPYFGTERFGAQVPCDGERHRVDIEVNRQTDSPFNPGVKHVRTSLNVLVFDCIFCENPVVTEAAFPVLINFQGFKSLPVF